MSRIHPGGTAAAHAQLGDLVIDIDGVNDPAAQERRKAFAIQQAVYRDPLPPRTTPVLEPEEVADLATRRQLFEKNKGLLITSGDPKVVLDGAMLAEQFAEFRRTATVDRRRNTQQFVGCVSFTVGAKHFGQEDQEFDFPNVYNLVKQSADEITIATSGLRVTFARKDKDDNRWGMVTARVSGEGSSGRVHKRTPRMTRL